VSNYSRFLCICTTSHEEYCSGSLLALEDCLKTQGVTAHLFVVIRESPADQSDVVSPERTLHFYSGTCGLSCARNIAIAFCSGTWLREVDYVAFVDDDLLYPDGLLARVALLFEQGADTALVAGAYGPTVDTVDRERFPDQRKTLGPDDALQHFCSGGMYLRADVVAKIGWFDERFGVGGRFGSGEDADYGLRALNVGTALYDPGLIAIHEYKAANRNRYVPGGFAIKAKHRQRGILGTKETLALARFSVGALLHQTIPWNVFIKAWYFWLVARLSRPQFPPR
jgi:GT2 family glycosyltransferase